VVALVTQTPARFSFTDPGALILLGAALISLGIWMRSVFLR